MTRSALARPSAPLTTSIGCQAPLMSTPSRVASSTLALGGVHLFDRVARDEHHVRASLCRGPGGVVRGVAENDESGRSDSLISRHVAEAARHRHHVDRGIAAADHDHALGDDPQTAFVEGRAGKRHR